MSVVDFVIEQRQRDIVEEYYNRIEKLFDVKIHIANGTAGKVWITLKGQPEYIEKAKNYVQALASPELRNEVQIPASLIKTFGPRTDEHFKLESEYGVVICFPHNAKAVIAGSTVDVMLATSKLEASIEKYGTVSPAKVPQPKPTQPKANRALEDFALKLGYEQEQINTVFEKLGPTVDKNTFLNELINVSGARTRIPDDRWLPVSQRPSGSSWQNGHQPEPYTRHPGEMVVAKGMLPTIGAHLNSQMYGLDTGVVARGMIPRTSANTAPSSSSPIHGYSNRDFAMAGNGNNLHGYNHGMPGMTTDSAIAQGYIPRTTGSSTLGSTLSSTGVISRGLIPRTTSQTTHGNNTTYSSSEWSERIPNGSYLALGGDQGIMNSDPQQVDRLVDQLLTTKYQQVPQSDLRHIVIDGSNVAMSHGNNKVFSCKGIALCVEWFRKRGHNQITVFVPTWRKESAKLDNPITDQHILTQLEAQGYLTFTPSRKVKGRRIVCYDDRFVIRLAESVDGVIVSNDNFKDLASEKPQWRDIIEQRLLMFSFVNDMFMPPDDPLGRHGPTLDEFLHKGTQTHRRVCPYGRRCTYGTRCKYHHPEREDHRLPLYQNLKVLFPSQDALIVSVMKKYPQEKDPDKLASHILNMMH